MKQNPSISHWLISAAAATLSFSCSSDSPNETTTGNATVTTSSVGTGNTTGSTGTSTTSVTTTGSTMDSGTTGTTGGTTDTSSTSSVNGTTGGTSIGMTGSGSGGTGSGTGGSGTNDVTTTMAASSTDGATTGAAGTTGTTATGAGGTGGTGSTTEGRSAGCGTEPGIPSNMYNNGERISIQAAGMDRRYILRVPDNYDNTHPYKLIFAWHQLDGNDVQMYANGYYHLLPLSDDSAIFVAPNGQKNGQPCTSTSNGDGGCGWPNTNGSDIALADAVLAELEANFCIDTNRIFATGWSYGGSMSYKHACERGLGGSKDGVEGYVRGIAVYSGAQLSGQCTPATPVAYYGSHGTSDNVLNYDGGVGLAQNFANANGCSWSTPTRATGNHVCTDIMGCMDGEPVKFCSFTGSHTPDPSDGGGGSWQYQLVWDFFDQF